MKTVYLLEYLDSDSKMVCRSDRWFKTMRDAIQHAFNTDVSSTFRVVSFVFNENLYYEINEGKVVLV